MVTETKETAAHAYVYRVLRYTPNLVRDEWVNIGVLVFDEKSGGCATTWKTASPPRAHCFAATATRTPEGTAARTG